MPLSKMDFANTQRTVLVKNRVSFLQLTLWCYFPSHIVSTTTNSLVMGYGRHGIYFTLFHKAAFLSRTLLPRILEIKARQGRSNQVAAVETGSKAGRTFPPDAQSSWRTGNVLGRNEVGASLKVWEEAYVMVHSQKGAEKMECPGEQTRQKTFSSTAWLANSAAHCLVHL